MKYTKIARELMDNTNIYGMIADAYDNNTVPNIKETTKIAKLANEIETIDNIKQVKKIIDKMLKEIDELENESYKATYIIAKSDTYNMYDVFLDDEFIKTVTKDETKQYIQMNKHK